MFCKGAALKVRIDTQGSVRVLSSAALQYQDPSPNDNMLVRYYLGLLRF